jgi:DNA invertase Pin-like site-specific DNA recombinase
MTGYKRPAAYIRIARGGGPGMFAGQWQAIVETARARGWSEPAIYLDVDGADAAQERGPGIAQLAAAISTGQHDALILGGVGTIYGNPADLMRLLHGCARSGVAVECVTGLSDPGPGGPSGSCGYPREGRGRGI